MEVDDGVGGADDGCLCVLCAGGASGGASGCREVRVKVESTVIVCMVGAVCGSRRACLSVDDCRRGCF